MSKTIEKSLHWPPTLDVGGVRYEPMTMTALHNRDGRSYCVMAHRHASLEQVHEAHALMLEASRKPAGDKLES